MASVPFTFTPDTVSDANQVNANFQAVANPKQITGPLGLGSDSPPPEAASGQLFVDFIAVRPSAPVPTGVASARFGGNAYIDNANQWRYIAAGPAFSFVCRSDSGMWQFRTAPPGAADAIISAPGQQGGWNNVMWLGPTTVVEFLPAAIGGIGTAVGRFAVNAYIDETSQWRYLNNGPAFSFVCRQDTGEWNFRYAVSGVAGAALGAYGTPTGWNVALSVDTTPAAGQTGLTLVTPTGPQRVLLGTALTVATAGMPIGARALYVPT